MWYAQHKSVGLYFKIIYLTAASIINRHLNTISYFKGLLVPPPALLALLRPEQRALFES